jgi:uridine phosphorylase
MLDFLCRDPCTIVQPEKMVRAFACRKGPSDVDLSLEPLALITFNPWDLREFLQGARKEKRVGRVHAWTGRNNRMFRGNGWVAVQSPYGAPNAVMVLEELVAFGVRKALYLGYCGSLQEEIKVGDVIIPDEALREEGTSYHYLDRSERSLPDPALQGELFRWLEKAGPSVHKGKVWTTDAPYRETPQKARKYAAQGILGVEMEMSAVFALGRARGITVGSVLLVSDEIRETEWRIGFFASSLKSVRKRVIQELLIHLDQL